MKNAFKGYRPFLLQLLATTLMVCLLPLVFLSMRVVGSQQSQLREAERRALETVADSLTGQWQNNMLSIENMQIKHQTLNKLMDGMMTQSVQAELDALETLNYLEIGQNYLSDSGIIRLAEENAVYLSRSKYLLTYFAPQYFGITGETFEALLRDLTGPTFLPWNESRGLMVYLYPERQVRPEVKRFGIYMFSQSSLQEAHAALLSGDYVLDRIEDRTGQVIYQNGAPLSALVWQGEADEYGAVKTEEGVWLRISRVSSGNCTLYLRKLETEAADRLQKWSHSMLVLISLVAGMTVLSAFAAVMINYRPIHKAMRAIREEDTPSARQNEITTLVNAYGKQKMQRQDMERRSETYRNMMLERIYKCLLGGRALTNEEHELLHWQNLPYFVAVCDLVDCGVLEEAQMVQMEEKHIRPVNMRMDRCMAFVCIFPQEEKKEQMDLARTLLQILGNADAALGVSRVYRTPEDFRGAYVEAILASQGCPDGGIIFAEDMPPHRLPTLKETSFDTMQWISMIRKGEREALEKLRRMLDEVELSNEDENVRQYAFFQRMEYTRSAIQKAGVRVEENRFAQIASVPDLAGRKEAMLTLLENVLAERSDAALLEKTALEREMIAYVEQHFSSSDFSLDMFAERFHMNLSAASRVFKDVVGVNFKKYINSRRLALAKMLLDETNLSVTVIAERVGFSSDSYFIQVFKASEHKTPTAWREERKAKEKRL